MTPLRNHRNRRGRSSRSRTSRGSTWPSTCTTRTTRPSSRAAVGVFACLARLVLGKGLPPRYFSNSITTGWQGRPSPRSSPSSRSWASPSSSLGPTGGRFCLSGCDRRVLFPLQTTCVHTCHHYHHHHVTQRAVPQEVQGEGRPALPPPLRHQEGGGPQVPQPPGAFVVLMRASDD